MTKRCKDCWLAQNGKCRYWGFPLYHDQRACNHSAADPKPDDVGVFPCGRKLRSIMFPEDMLNTHDMSDKRHTLIFKTACVRGLWYVGQHYQRHYDSMYGSGWACGIYDGEYATEQEAINTMIEQLIKDETQYHCAEAVEFLKAKRFENRQLTLFD